MTDRHRTHHRTILGAASIAMLPGVAAATPTLATLAGTWTVTHVRSDEDTSRRTALPPDDPRLVGRRLTITPDSLTLQTLQGPEQCGAATAAATHTQVSRLLPGGTDPGTGGKPAAYGLPFAATDTVDALVLACGQGNIGAGLASGPAGANATWLLALPDATLVMSYLDGSLLILSRPAAAPRASFACHAAATATEHAICASPDLAGLDSSVAAAFSADTRQFTGIGDPAALAKLRASQKTWLHQRDACAGDAACLVRVMGARIQMLADPQSFTGD